MAGTVTVQGWEPGENVGVFPVVDLEPRGRPIRTAVAKKDGSLSVGVWDPGAYYLCSANGRRVRVEIPGQVEATATADIGLTDDEIRERLAETRPPKPEGETVVGARSTATTRPKRKRLLGRNKK
jgi:hypothetical protein